MENAQSLHKGRKFSAQTAADLAIMFCAIAWGASTVVGKVALGSLPPFAFITVRFILAVATLAVIYYRRILKSTRKDWIVGAATGFLLFGAYGSQLIGLKYTSVANATFIAALAVVIIPILESLKRRSYPSNYVIISVVLCTVGLYILTGSQAKGFNLGDFLNLICAVSYSFYVMVIDRYAHEIDSIVVSISQFIVVAILGAIGMFALESVTASQIIGSWFAVVFTGIIATAVVIPVQLMAQKYTSPTRVGILVLLEPVSGTLLAVLFINEVLTSAGLVGSSLILLGLFLAEWKKV
jgi:drug/metabolite transporter (DMT)-like permease